MQPGDQLVLRDTSDVPGPRLGVSDVRLAGERGEARIRVVESVYPDVMRLFRDESIDLAIGPVPEKAPSEGYRVEVLGEMPMCVAMSPKRSRLRATP